MNDDLIMLNDYALLLNQPLPDQLTPPPSPPVPTNY